MPNTNFVPNWTFERTLPSPFDSYSGKSAVMKDIASKYCNQPKKRATLHSATLQAVFSYMNLENPPAGKAEEELGAIGSQANNFTIAEYPSRTGLLHVVVYNRMTGKFIAGKYEKPLDLDSKPEPYQFKKDEDSGSALYFALMPTFLSDDEFNEKYQELKQHRDDGFPDLPKAAETAAVLCDNVYRRIRYGDSLPIGNIKVDTPANGVLQRLTPLNIQKGVYAPTEIIQGTFQVLKGGHHYTASAVSIPKEDFVDKYILSNSRTLTPQEESTVPILEDWYVIPKEIQRICEHAKLTTDSKQPMRNFMLRGPAGTGKTEGAKAIAAGLHLPYRCITCSANTEIFDLLGQILPDVDEKQLSLVGELPSFQDITLDPATAYEKLTGTYDEKVSENTVYEELIHHISEEMKQKQAATSSSQQFRYVDTPLVEAIRNGYLVEIQEPTVIANAGTTTRAISEWYVCRLKNFNKEAAEKTASFYKGKEISMDYATTLNIDQQGRIIIPAKVRKALQLHTGDVLMLEADTRNICLRKCDSHIPMDIRLDSFLDILHSNVPCRILLCNHSKIIASKNYHTALNMPVTESIQRLLQQGKMKLFSEKERIYPTMTGKYPISAFFPISKKNELGETLGLLLCTKNQQPFSEMDLGCAKMTAAAISRYIQQNYERTVI